MRNTPTVVAGVMLIILLGCTVRETRGITAQLQPDDLYVSYGVTPANLKALSKCPFPPSINIVNKEAREEDYVFWKNNAGGIFTLNPRELTAAIVEYLKYGFKKSQIIIDSNSPKIIYISLAYARASLPGYTYDTNIGINLHVPEINYSSVYDANDRAWRSHTKAMAYASHVVTRQIIDDPVIQEYILCNSPDNQFSSPGKKITPQRVDTPSKYQPSLPEIPQMNKSVTSEARTNIIIVTGTAANIRSGAGNEFLIVTTVKQGDKLVLLGEHGEWFNVRLENGKEGWINSRFIKEQ